MYKKNKMVSTLYTRDQKMKKILLLTILIVLILIGGTIGVKFLIAKYKDSSPYSDSQAVVGQLEGKSKQEIQDELDRVIKQSNIVVSINTNMTMKDGKSKANVKIENVPNNHYAMKVIIKLRNSNKIIYKSGFIEPNYHIQDANLLKKLPKGKYDALAVFEAYTLKNHKYVGKQRVLVTIKVNK